MSVSINRTDLPGIGVRWEFFTAQQRRVAVVLHRDGRRHLVIYDTADPDAGREVLSLTDEEGDALAELLGAPRLLLSPAAPPGRPDPSRGRDA